MCVYDLTNEKSFEHLENYWLKEIRNHAPSNAVLLLVGNKADMEEERKVDFDRAKRYVIFINATINNFVFQKYKLIFNTTFFLSFII